MGKWPKYDPNDKRPINPHARDGENKGIGTYRCGAFYTLPVGYNRWKFKCDWLPDWSMEQECTGATASALVIQLEYEYRGHGGPETFINGPHVKGHHTIRRVK